MNYPQRESEESDLSVVQLTSNNVLHVRLHKNSLLQLQDFTLICLNNLHGLVYNYDVYMSAMLMSSP